MPESVPQRSPGRSQDVANGHGDKRMMHPPGAEVTMKKTVTVYRIIDRRCSEAGVSADHGGVNSARAEFGRRLIVALKKIRGHITNRLTPICRHFFSQWHPRVHALPVVVSSTLNREHALGILPRPFDRESLRVVSPAAAKKLVL